MDQRCRIGRYEWRGFVIAEKAKETKTEIKGRKKKERKKEKEMIVDCLMKAIMFTKHVFTGFVIEDRKIERKRGRGRGREKQ